MGGFPIGLFILMVYGGSVMRYCHECGAEYVDGTDFCVDCNVELQDDPPEEISFDDEEMDLVVLTEVPDEITAMLFRDMLDERGVVANIHSEEIAAFPGAEKNIAGCWGEIVVREEDYDKARKILDEYLAAEMDNDTDDADLIEEDEEEELSEEEYNKILAEFEEENKDDKS
jgi:hypothetical protein